MGIKVYINGNTITLLPPKMPLPCKTKTVFLMPNSLQTKTCLLSGWTKKPDSSIYIYVYMYIAPFISLKVHMLCCLLSAGATAPCFKRSLYYWSARYRPTVWSRIRADRVEIMVLVDEWKCWWRRVSFIFRCLRTIIIKYRFSVEKVPLCFF